MTLIWTLTFKHPNQKISRQQLPEGAEDPTFFGGTIRALHIHTIKVNVLWKNGPPHRQPKLQLDTISLHYQFSFWFNHNCLNLVLKWPRLKKIPGWGEWGCALFIPFVVYSMCIVYPLRGIQYVYCLSTSWDTICVLFIHFVRYSMCIVYPLRGIQYVMLKHHHSSLPVPIRWRRVRCN